MFANVVHQICGNQMLRVNVEIIRFMVQLVILEMLIFTIRNRPMWQS